MKTLMLLLLAVAGCQRTPEAPVSRPISKGNFVEKNSANKIEKSDEEWKKELDPQAYDVLRKHGTERAFTGKYVDHKDEGMYVCAACGLELFASEAKFDSGTGWPSFTAPVGATNVATSEDDSYGMRRIEVHCPRCGGHLGHLFPDGPPEKGGKRFCINSCSLNFKKK